jgi:hypothetical protein
MFAGPTMTSAAPAVTAQDLDLEHAELLPARETLTASIHPGGPNLFYPVPVHPYPGDPGHFDLGPADPGPEGPGHVIPLT